MWARPETYVPKPTSCQGQPDGPIELAIGKTYCQDGWTMLLKADGDSQLEYHDALWTNNQLLNTNSNNMDSLDAKFQAFTDLKINELKATFPSKGSAYTFTTGKMCSLKTAAQIFQAGEQLSGSCAVPNSYSSQWPSGWSTQPNCKKFGINLDDNYRAARFGFQANQENNCASHDTAAGLGLGPLGHSASNEHHGAGDMCLSSNCNRGNTNNGYQGLLWGK